MLRLHCSTSISGASDIYHLSYQVQLVLATSTPSWEDTAPLGCVASYHQMQRVQNSILSSPLNVIEMSVFRSTERRHLFCGG